MNSRGGGGEVCRYFLQGKCRYGASCRFLHPQRNRQDGGRRGEQSRQQNDSSFSYNRRDGGHDNRWGGKDTDRNRFNYFNSDFTWNQQNRKGGGGGGGGYSDRGGRGGKGQDSSGYHSYGRDSQGGRGYSDRGGGRHSDRGGGGGGGYPIRSAPAEPNSPAEFAEGKCVAGLEDVSPEELRWKAYQAMANPAAQAEYHKELEVLNGRVARIRQDLRGVTPGNVQLLMSGGADQNTSLFGSAAASSSSPSFLFSPPPSTPSSTQPLSLFTSSSSSSVSSPIIHSSQQSSLFQTSSPSVTQSVISRGGLFGQATTTQQVPLLQSNTLTPTNNSTSNSSMATTGLSGRPQSSGSSTNKLTDGDIQAYKAQHFTLGMIPETPPTPDLI